MNSNLILLIILFCVAIYIVNSNHIKQNKKKNNKHLTESFVNNNFKIDPNKINEERSVRFSKSLPYNSSRVVYAFDDIEYFNQNKDNLFNYYGIKSEKLKSYFDEKYNDIKNKVTFSNEFKGEITKQQKENLFKSENHEIGLGIDNVKNIKKIYILVNRDIYSLKKNNQNYVESIYKDNYDIKKEDIKSYYGTKYFEIIDRNMKILKLTLNNNFQNTIKSMKDFATRMNSNIDLTMLQNLFDRDLKQQYKESYKELNQFHCFTRYDNNVMTGYNYDIYEKKLAIKDSRYFLTKLLNELKCNIQNLDKWIKENGEHYITYISFIKEGNDIIVTVYYNKGYY